MSASLSLAGSIPLSGQGTGKFFVVNLSRVLYRFKCHYDCHDAIFQVTATSEMRSLLGHRRAVWKTCIRTHDTHYFIKHP